MILPEIEGVEDAVRIVEKALEAVARPFYPKNKTCRVGASIGISIFPDHGQDRETLLKRADRAMYVAKEDGKGRYHVYGS